MTIEAAPDTKDAEFIATLKRGKSYTLGTDPSTSVRFTVGEDYPITAELKAILERKAVDEIDTGDTDEDGYVLTEPKCKFDFRRAGESASKAVSPRRRARPSDDD